MPMWRVDLVHHLSAGWAGCPPPFPVSQKSTLFLSRRVLLSLKRDSATPRHVCWPRACRHPVRLCGDHQMTTQPARSPKNSVTFRLTPRPPGGRGGCAPILQRSMRSRCRIRAPPGTRHARIRGIVLRVAALRHATHRRLRASPYRARIPFPPRVTEGLPLVGLGASLRGRKPFPP